MPTRHKSTRINTRYEVDDVGTIEFQEGLAVTPTEVAMNLQIHGAYTIRGEVYVFGQIDGASPASSASHSYVLPRDTLPDWIQTLVDATTAPFLTGRT